MYCNGVGKTPQGALSSRVPIGGRVGICVGFIKELSMSQDFMALPAQPGFNFTVGTVHLLQYIVITIGSYL